MITYYYCIFSSTSRNSAQGCRYKVALHSEDDIVDFASAECMREGVNVPETLEDAVAKLSDDGRAFTIYPDTETGRAQFLADATELNLRDDARGLLDLREALDRIRFSA